MLQLDTVLQASKGQSRRAEFCKGWRQSSLLLMTRLAAPSRYDVFRVGHNPTMSQLVVMSQRQLPALSVHKLGGCHNVLCYAPHAATCSQQEREPRPVIKSPLKHS